MVGLTMLLLAAAPVVAQPVGSGNWVTVADYPAEALAAHQEGTVVFTLEVSAAGSVTSCRITGSSGVPALDVRTCALMFERGRFRPTELPPGTIGAIFASRVRWVYPTIQTAPAPKPVELKPGIRLGEGKSVLYIDERGIITSCEIAPPSYSNLLPLPDLCALFPAGTRYAPPGTIRGKPVKRKVDLGLSIYDVTVK